MSEAGWDNLTSATFEVGNTALEMADNAHVWSDPKRCEVSGRAYECPVLVRLQGGRYYVATVRVHRRVWPSWRQVGEWRYVGQVNPWRKQQITRNR